MSSSILNSAFENPCFVADSELTIQSLQESDTAHTDDVAHLPLDHFECNSLSYSSEKCSMENVHSELNRPSISATSSAPLEHLENFLSDARSSLDESPVAALRRLSVVKFDAPLEDYPRYL